MKTILYTAQQFAEAAAWIRKGNLVVFPTETVYGLGASALNPVACTRIFSAKGRPSDNPLIVHIASQEQLAEVAGEIPEMARKLMTAFWPGPLSLILPKNPALPDIVTAGLPNVGVRWPSDPVAQAFLQECGVPVAAPSANVSGLPSPTSLDMAKFSMLGRAEAILAGEDSVIGLESTIVGFPDGQPKIFRPGSITAEQLAEVLQVEPASLQLAAPAEGARPLSPGMRYTHYKPEAEVKLFTKGEDLTTWFASEEKIGLLAVDVPQGLPEGWVIKPCADWNEFARVLYRSFHDFDRVGCSLILAQLPGSEGLGLAIRNRLSKAAGQGS